MTQLKQPGVDKTFADEARIDAALKRATRTAFERHARLGEDVVTMIDGEVVTISGAEARAAFDAANSFFAKQTP